MLHTALVVTHMQAIYKYTSVFLQLPLMKLLFDFRVAECITHLDRWMTMNRQNLNDDKTQPIWLGTRQQLAKLTVTTPTDYVSSPTDYVSCRVRLSGH